MRAGDPVQERAVGPDSIAESRGVCALGPPGTVAEARCVWASGLSVAPTLCKLPISAVLVNNLNQKSVSKDAPEQNRKRAVRQRELLLK